MCADGLLARLDPGFFAQEVHALARALLGCELVRVSPDGVRRARIVEVEAYAGPEDPASHARCGRPTARNRAMFGPPGHAYVYRSHGRHHCLNVVAGPEGVARAVLIRAAMPLEGLEAMAKARGLAPGPTTARALLSGPGKLCQALCVDLGFDGAALLPPSPLYLCAATDAPGEQTVRTSARIGLNPLTVGEAARWPWRYALAESPWASRKP